MEMAKFQTVGGSEEQLAAIGSGENKDQMYK